MRKLLVFNLVSLDGYFSGEGGDISWHLVDDEFQELADKAAYSGSTLLFGRVTYELMAGFWPTPEAIKTDPIVAAGMNQAEKIVFSRTLERADWHNTRLVKGELIAAVRKLKEGAGANLAVLGSGTIVAQLAAAGLIDEYQILVNPVVLGKGRTMFAGVPQRFPLKLLSSRTFGNGNVLLCYEPVREGGEG